MLRALTLLLASLAIAGPVSADDALNAKIDRAIQKAHARPLSPAKDTPWVIMHAVIAFEREVRVTLPDGKKMEGVEFLLNQAKDEHGPLYRFENENVPRIRTRDIHPGFHDSFILQDHIDQFLMSYADAAVPLTMTGRSDKRAFTVQTLLDAAMTEYKPSQEVAYTMVVTSAYLPIDRKWKTAAGKEMSIADIVAEAVTRDPNRETEGGTHHFYGIAYALDRYKAANPGKALTGPWADARAYLDRYVARTKELQNADGSFSQSIVRRAQQPRDARDMVWSTGHALEWLCRALTPEQLREPWVARAAGTLADGIINSDLEQLSMGGLYHAAHSLRLYREATRK